MVASNNGAPVRISDVGEVTIGHAPRLGEFGFADKEKDNPDAVEGVIQSGFAVSFGLHYSSLSSIFLRRERCQFVHCIAEAVNRDRIRPKIGYIQQGIVRRDHGTYRVIANQVQITSTNLQQELARAIPPAGTPIELQGGTSLGKIRQRIPPLK